MSISKIRTAASDVMRTRWFRMFALVAALTAWLAWDLTQAGNDPGYGFVSFVPAASFPQRAAVPTTVAIVRSNDPALANPIAVTDSNITAQTIEQMVRRAVALAGGFQGTISSGNMVLIKPNLVDIEPSGCGEITDVRVVRALVKIIDEIDHGKITIVVGEGSPRPFTTFEKATGTTQKAWTQLFDVPGYQTLKTEMLAAGINFRLSNLNGNSDTDPWPELRLVDVPGGGQAQPQGGKYYVHQDIVNADVYISVPVLKIHDPGVTVGLKNQIGTAASTRYGFNKMTGVVQEARIHKLDHLAKAPYAWTDKEIVDLCAIAMAKKTFVLVDAVACLESQKDAVRDLSGTITNLVRMNTVVCGRDPVAVDHICTRIMGLNPDDIEHITLAEKVGLGTNDPSLITVAGTPLDSIARRFKKRQSESGLYGQGNREWIVKGTYPVAGITTPINYEFLPGEAALTPVPGRDGWSAATYFINDRINLKDYFGLASDQVVAYAFTRFTAPKDQEAELWVGSDDPLKIWLNGTPVYTYTGSRTFLATAYYSERIKVNIRKGENTLLVKSQQLFGYFDFSVNICDVEPNILYAGNRVWGLKFSAAAPATGVGGTRVPQVPAVDLAEVYPNPFNPATTIRYQPGSAGPVRLAVFDLAGRELVLLAEGERTAGWHAVRFDATGLASGIYLCRLQTATGTISRKLVLLR